MPSFRAVSPSVIGTAVFFLAGASSSAPPVHPAHASRAAQSPAPGGPFANVRMLPFESETIHVSLGASGPPTPIAATATSSAPPAGVLTPAIAHDIVHAHIHELTACAAAGAMNGRVHGSVTLRIVVDPHGGIRNVVVPQSTMVWSVPRCMTDAASHWVFPHPPTGLTIVIVAPFVFTSE